MPDLRDMQLLTALARHNHFARAAAECGISQPAFSGRIRNLETDLGVPLVKRGNKFLGFTKEGEIALTWARRMLADADGLRQDIEAAKGALSGQVVVGAVPTALTFASQVPAMLRASHPKLLIQILSLSSSRIHQGLVDFSLDAGVTYLDHELPPGLIVEPLYRERYVLLAPAALFPVEDAEPSPSVTWASAIDLPLCLLTRDMRNRRILDTIFEDVVGRRPTPVMETNAFTALLAMVASGAAATIAPEFLADGLQVPSSVRRATLAEPDVTTPIGVVVADNEPKSPALKALVTALKATAR